MIIRIFRHGPAHLLLVWCELVATRKYASFKHCIDNKKISKAIFIEIFLIKEF